MKGRLRTNFILNLISQVLRIITPFITTPYVARVLGVDNVGIFSYSLSYQSYFTLLAVLGTAAYGAREIARNRDNRQLTTVTFWEIQILRVFTTLVSLAGWAILIEQQGENKIVFIILTAYIIAALFDISWFYTGLEMFAYIVARTILIRVVEVIAIFTLVKDSSDLPLYCGIMSGGMLIGSLSLWLNLHKYVDKVNLRELRPFSHLKGTLIFFLPSIATTIYTVLDKTLIGLITASTYENGIYEQATKVIEIAKAVTITSLSTVLSPRSTYWYKNRDYDLIKSNLFLSVDIMLCIGFGFVFGISAVADRFVPVFFGAGYDGVILLLRLLSPIIVVITISGALGDQYYNPAGLRLKSSIFLIIGACCNLVLNLILIPMYKSAGAVIASVCAETIITALYLINCDGYLKLKQIITVSYKKIIAGTGMLIAINLAKSIIPANVIGLFLLVGGGAAVYFLLLLIIRDSAVLKVLHELIGGIKKKLIRNR